MDRLLALPRFAEAGSDAYRPGIERVRALLAAVGGPHLGIPVIHVAGTNGKGSAASLATAVASATGRRVGLHTSPHLQSVTERMRIDGAPVSAEWLAEAMARVADDIDRIGVSFFEATVALSLLAFAEHGVDLAVVEVGLGGRLDATNVLDAEVAVVTHIGLDHTDLLGNSLEAIAREKAGIASKGAAFVHGATEPEAAAALEAEAERRGARVEALAVSTSITDVREEESAVTMRLSTPVRSYGRLRVGLPGHHQAENAALAVRAVEHLLGDVGRGPVRDGLAEVMSRSGLRGRGETLGPEGWHRRVRIDVAHNPDGWRQAIRLALPPDGGRLYALCGMMRDKEAEVLARALWQVGAEAWPVTPGGERGMPRTEWKRVLTAAGVAIHTPSDVSEALSRFASLSTSKDRLLVTGSHAVVAEAVEAADAMA